MGGAKASAENQNVPGNIDPQQQRHKTSKRPVDGVEGSNVSEINNENASPNPHENRAAQSGSPHLGEAIAIVQGAVRGVVAQVAQETAIFNLLKKKT